MKQFFEELKRRNIFKVATAYGIVSWLIIQISDTVFPRFHFPDWTVTFVIILVIIGFPVALLLAWSFELTPEGIKKTVSVEKNTSISKRTGAKLNRIIIGVLALALGYFIYESRFSKSSENVESVVATAEVTTVEQSVAVLPFADLSEKKDQEWFSDGLTEEILNSLARLPQLKVASRTSAFEFKGTNEDIKIIANKLGVAHIVEGSVRRIGDRLKLTAQLIRASDGFHIWSQTYDRSTADLFEVQEDIAEKIANALDIYLDDQKRKRMFSSGTRNVEAFELFLQGKKIFMDSHENKTNQTLWDANVLFEKAMKADPKFVLPAINHMDAYSHTVIGAVRDPILKDGPKLTKEEARQLLLNDLDFVIQNTDNPTLGAIASLNQTFFTDDWSSMPKQIAQLEAHFDLNLLKMDETVWLNEIIMILGRTDLLQQIVDRSKITDPYYNDTWNTSLKLSIAKDNAEGFKEALKNLKSLKSSELLPPSCLPVAINWDWNEILNCVTANSSNKLQEALVLYQNGKKQEAEEIVNSLDRDNLLASFSSVISYYYLTENYNAIQEWVQEIDKKPYSGVIFSLLIVEFGNYSFFDLDDTPNYKANLKKANVDLSLFRKFPKADLSKLN